MISILIIFLDHYCKYQIQSVDSFFALQEFSEIIFYSLFIVSPPPQNKRSLLFALNLAKRFCSMLTLLVANFRFSDTMVSRSSRILAFIPSRSFLSFSKRARSCLTLVSY
jgi:hypothetical protein